MVFYSSILQARKQALAGAGAAVMSVRGKAGKGTQVSHFLFDIFLSKLTVDSKYF